MNRHAQRRLNVVALALTLSAAPLAAQHGMGAEAAGPAPADNQVVKLASASCPAADSLLGPAEKARTFNGKWDDLEGTTTYFLSWGTSTKLFSHTDVQINFVASHAGKAPAPSRFGLLADLTTDAGSLVEALSLKEHSKAQEMLRAPVLVDDSIRFALEAHAAQSGQRHDFFVGEERKESAQYELTPEQAAVIARAKSVKLRVTDRTFTFDRGKLGSFREYYRTALCGAGIAKDPGAGPGSP